MRLARALKRQSILSKLPEISNARCCLAALAAVCTILLLAFIDICFLDSDIFLPDYGFYLLAMVLCSFAQLSASVFILQKSRNKRHAYKLISNIYVSVMAALMFLTADRFLQLTGSLALYFCCILFISIVPVLEIMGRLTQAAAQLSVMAAYIIYYHEISALIWQAVFINLAAVPLNYWKYYTVIKKLELKSIMTDKKQDSERDELSGLLSRRGFEGRIDIDYPLLEKHHISVGLIVLDIDAFKECDERLGYGAKDKCIKRVASALEKSALNGKALKASFGEGKFVALIQEIEKLDLILTAKRIQNILKTDETDNAAKRGEGRLTVSIGLSYCDGKKLIPYNELYSNAERELGIKAKGIIKGDFIRLEGKTIYSGGGYVQPGLAASGN